MNVALPVLLLIFGSLTFWLLTESSIKWYVKTACIGTFCVFTIIFWTTIHTFLGWPALENDMPETVLIHWAVIKEPNKSQGFKGKIYFLLESGDEKETSFFGYKRTGQEPRLFGISYSRKLHEKVEKEMMGKLQRGQLVAGKFSKKDGQSGNPRAGETGEDDGDERSKGGGSESQKQDWEFHFLLPSDLLKKQGNLK